MKIHLYKLTVPLALALVALSAPDLSASEASRDVGVAQQELGTKAQKEISEKMTEPKAKKKPRKSAEEAIGEIAPASASTGTATAVEGESAPEAKEEGGKAEGERVTSLVIDGDAALLDEAAVRAELEAALVGRTLTEAKAKKAVKAIETRLHEAGYYFATIALEWPAKDGALTLVVDQGRYGEIRLHRRGGDGKQPYTGRYFSPENVLKRLQTLKEGDAFQYGELYTAVYRINAHPDLAADVDLKPREEKKGKYTRRVVDMDFSVEDDLPLHGALELANNGTDVTDEWGASLTLQYLNLSGNDDVITLNVPVSIDLESLTSVSLGYYRPVDWRQGGSIAVFGGYSELQSDSIVDEIGLEGDGWFTGVQGGYNFIDNDDYTLVGSLGISHSVVKDNLVLQGQDELDREVSLTPVLLLANYIANQPDRWGGLTAASLGLTVHASAFPGASDDEDFELQRENAKADYLVVRASASRIQGVFASEKDPDTSWTLFTKVDGQVASEPLIPSEQKGMGGYDTVRGYIEREFLGDDGLNATAELRTPIRTSSVFPKWFNKYDEKKPAFETLQGVFFLDAGYLSLKDSLAGEESDYTLASVGLGCRVALGSVSQLRADWGFPLEETEDSDMSGRGHISLQFLF